MAKRAIKFLLYFQVWYGSNLDKTFVFRGEKQTNTRDHKPPKPKALKASLY